MRPAPLCRVWIATADPDAAAADVLSPAELRRAAAYRRPGDRSRFATGAVLLRHVAAELLGGHPADVPVDRVCPQCGDADHGPPTLAGRDLSVSISHSGDLLLLAAVHGHGVGVDVERRRDVDVDTLAAKALAPGEAVADAEGFQRLWTRKEATVKATRDGVTVPLSGVALSGEDTDGARRLLAYPGRPDLCGFVRDVPVAAGYVAAVCVLAPEPPRLVCATVRTRVSDCSRVRSARPAGAASEAVCASSSGRPTPSPGGGSPPAPTPS